MQIQLQLNINEQKLQKFSSRLSSGLRINGPEDDPSGFAIAAKLQTRTQSYDAASENIQHANNAITIGTGALQTVTSILQRMRVLSVQASSTLLSTSDLAHIQTEIQQLNSEINAIGQQTNYDGVPLFPATETYTTPDVQQKATYNSGSSVVSNFSLSLPSTPKAGDLLITMISYGHNNYAAPPTVNGPAGWTLVSSYDSNSPTTLVPNHSDGEGILIYETVYQAGGPTTFNYTKSYSGVTTAATFDISGVDLSQGTQSAQATWETGPVDTTPSITTTMPNDEALAFIQAYNPGATGTVTSTGAAWQEVFVDSNTRALEVQEASIPTADTTVHAGYTWPNTAPATEEGFASILLLAPIQTVSPFTASIQTGAALGDQLSTAFPIVSAYQFGTETLDLDTLSGAQNAITTIDKALGAIVTAQASLGAAQIRLQAQADNNARASLSLTAAESTIRDLNVAQGATELTKERMLTNFGMTLLAQTNQDAANVLQLFR
jgi:flagellin